MDRISIGRNQILDVGQNRGLEARPIGKSQETQEGKGFAETLQEAVGNVNEMQVNADKQVQNLVTGRTDNVADVMIASEKADIALKLMVQVRNKIIDAYQEIMKMQV